MSLHEKLKTTDLVLLASLISSIVILGSIILSIKSPEISSRPDMVLYDSSTRELVEIHGRCPSCGEEAHGFNGQLVCDNQDCDLYGLAVDIQHED